VRANAACVREGAEVLDWAGGFFLGTSPPHDAARRIAQVLTDAGIPLIRENDLPIDWPVDPWVGERYREMWANAEIDDER
jgi:hypothetical protein